MLHIDARLFFKNEDIPEFHETLVSAYVYHECRHASIHIEQATTLLHWYSGNRPTTITWLS